MKEFTEIISLYSILDGARLVVLWAYFRGGSSYVGELLSANKATVYFYEPLWLFRDGLTPWKQRFKYLDDLFDCDEKAIDRLLEKKNLLLPKPLESVGDCLTSPTRVMKVNRLEVPSGTEWILHHAWSLRDNIKVSNGMEKLRLQI